MTIKTVKVLGSYESEADLKAKDDENVIALTEALKKECDKYRLSFESNWQLITERLNFEFPPEWLNIMNEPENNWKSRVFIGILKKMSESWYAAMFEMIFGRGRWFSFKGIKDDNYTSNLALFFDELLKRGGFSRQNKFCLRQAGNLGTSIMSISVNHDPENFGFIFDWRTINNCGFDPDTIVEFKKGRYFYEDYTVTVDEILASELYSKEAKDKLLLYLNGKKGTKSDNEKTLTYQLSAGSEIIVSGEYMTVPCRKWNLEYPVKYFKFVKNSAGEMEKVPYYKNEKRIVVIADKKIVLRNDYNEFEEITAVRYRCVVNEFTCFGEGLKGVVTIQDTMNSLVNSCVNGVKLANTIMLKYAGDAVSDPDSLCIKPENMIEMEAGKFEQLQFFHYNTVNVNDTVKMILFLDEIAQDIKGLTRSVDGSPAISAQEADTLGQTQLKLQQATKRLLGHAMETSEEGPLEILRIMVRIIKNPKFIDRFQALANKIVGTYEIADPNQGILARLGIKKSLPKKNIPKLDLKRLGELDIDFTPICLLDFIEKQEIMEKIFRLIELASKVDPEFVKAALSKLIPEKLGERWIKGMDLPGTEDFMHQEGEEQGPTKEQLLEIVQMLAEKIKQLDPSGASLAGMDGSQPPPMSPPPPGVV